jgi:putative transposase/transposase-like zinc-binding protein
MQIIRGKKLKRIFSDHWPYISQKYRELLKRPAIAKNVSKMLHCGTEVMGFHLWKCSNCQSEKKVFHTCKSRFCPSCGIAQTKRWKEKFQLLFANTTYKHIIFHPPSEFWGYFQLGKTAYYNMLFAVSHQALKEWYTDKDYLPGIMAVIHTFGRDENFTPHTHLLVTCGGLNNSHTRWVTPVRDGFIPHQVLRQSFQTHFLKRMRELWQNQLLDTIPSHYRYLFAPLVQNRVVQEVVKKVWYVWVGKRMDNGFNAASYVARYTKRPPVAESSILEYDGERVLFTFVEHKTQKRQCLDLSAEEFIKLLIYHIPDNNFRVVRYYGVFANRVRGKLLPQVFAMLGDNYWEVKAKLERHVSWWRRQLELFTRCDPLFCGLCRIPYDLISVVYATNAYG